MSRIRAVEIIRPGPPGDLTQAVADGLYADKDDTEAAIARTDPGSDGTELQTTRIVGGDPAWLDHDRVPLEALGIVYNDSDADTANSTALNAAMAAIEGSSQAVNADKFLTVRPMPVYLDAAIDIADVFSVVFEGSGAASFNEGAAYGSQFIGTTDNMTLFDAGSAASANNLLGPRFIGIGFQVPTGGKAAHLRLSNRWGFDRCTFRGIGDPTELVTIDADSTGLGGSVSGGDASWGFFNHCTFAGYTNAINSVQTFGFTVFGGEFTAPAGTSNAIYGMGSHVRVFGPKFDGGTALDFVGESCEFHIDIESTQTQMIKLGNRSFHAGQTNTRNNLLVAFVTGINPTPADGIRLGQYAIGNTVLYTASNVTTRINAHASARNLIIALDTTRFNIDKDIPNDYAMRVSNVNSTNTGGLEVHAESGSGTAKAFNVRSLPVGGTPGDAFTVFANGSAQVRRTLTIASELDLDGVLNHDGSTVGFYGATPVAKPTVSGSAGGNAALQSLLTALENLGLITDSST